MLHFLHPLPYSELMLERGCYFGARAVADVDTWSPWLTEMFLPFFIALGSLAIQYFLFKSIAYAVTKDGKPTPLTVDSESKLHTREGYAPAAEDNTNGVIAIQNRPLAVGSYSKLHYTNLGRTSAACIKPSSGNLYGIDCSNTSDKDLFFQIYNTVSLPNETDIPALSLRVLPGADRSVGENIFGSGGLHLSVGITFVISLKPDAYSPALEDNHLVNIVYF